MGKVKGFEGELTMATKEATYPSLASVVTNVTIREGSQVPEHLRGTTVADKLRLLQLMAKMGPHVIELTGFSGSAWYRDRNELVSGASKMTLQVPLRALYFNPRGLTDLLQHPTLLRQGIFHTAATADYRASNYKQFGLEGEKGVHAAMDEMIAAFSANNLSFDYLVVSTAWGSKATRTTTKETVEFIDLLIVRAKSKGFPVKQLVLADTESVATVETVRELIEVAQLSWGETELTLHLHPAPQTAEQCVDSAIDAGVVHFEAAVGGVGGSPHANQPGGNLNFRVLINAWRKRGWETGLDLNALSQAEEFLARIQGKSSS